MSLIYFMHDFLFSGWNPVLTHHSVKTLRSPLLYTVQHFVCFSQHAMPPEFGEKWGTRCLNTRFPLHTLLWAAWSGYFCFVCQIIKMCLFAQERTFLFLLALYCMPNIRASSIFLSPHFPNFRDIARWLTPRVVLLPRRRSEIHSFLQSGIKQKNRYTYNRRTIFL